MNSHATHTAQFADLGISRENLESYLKGCGYWADAKMRERYYYELSPSAYVISPSQRVELERLVRTTYGAVRSLAERIATIGIQKSPSTHEEGRLMNLARGSNRNLLRPSDGVAAIPPVIKVDLVQSEDGHFGIAEVDVYNPRGLGFVALLEGGVPEEYRGARLPGVAGVASFFGHEPWDMALTILISEFERFYEPSYCILANVLNRTYGAGINVLRAGNVKTLDQVRRLLIIPDTLDATPHLREHLMARYRKGELNVLFPPAAYLGSKAYLPWLRSVPGMEEFIPPTAPVGKRCGDPHRVVSPEKPRVLKAAVSSGLKKVAFSDLDEGFDALLSEVQRQKNPSWILQEQVAQRPYPVVVFNEAGERVVRDYYLRVTTYIAEQGIVDVEVTGRPDRKVHGAPDCIMLPAILG